MRTSPEKNTSGPSDSGDETGTTAIEIQFTGAEMALLDAAAERLGLSKTDLLRTGGLAAASAALDEETNSVWSDEAFDALLRHLDAPVQFNAELVDMMSERPIWDR